MVTCCIRRRFPFVSNSSYSVCAAIINTMQSDLSKWLKLVKISE